MIFFLLYFLPFTFAVKNDSNPYPYMKKEGDILVYNTSGIVMAATALRNTSFKWPNGEVAVFFHASYSTQEIETIFQAMMEIQNKTCINFKRVAEDHHNYVHIIKPSAYGEKPQCSSVVGMIPKNSINRSQPLFLSDYCLRSRKTILHELMHVLGFVHEHNRHDRDEYVEVKFNNIADENEPNFKKRKEDDLTLLETGYAYDSIMHYTETEGSMDNESPTLIALKDGVTRMGGGEMLSPIDRKRINMHYNCEPKAPDDYYYDPEEEFSESFLEEIAWNYPDCPDAFAPAAEGGNCRWFLMKTRMDPSSAVHYFHCKKSPTQRDEGCGKWKREQCPVGMSFLSSHGSCRPAKSYQN